MTRQHFEMIAAALRASRPTNGEPLALHIANAALDRAAENLAVKFGADNPRFQTARFIAACRA